MARSFARIITAIWRNAEFRALHSGAQRVYMLLVTQPNISAAGTLPLTVRRWAEMASDTTVAQINRELAELARGRFIGIDPATEEVLVRSFVRWDGGYSNRKRRPVICAAASELVSPTLRGMLAGEFKRLGLPFVGDDHRPVTESTQDGDTETFPMVDRLSDSASDSEADTPTPFDRVVGCQGEYSGTTTLNPQPIPPSAASDPDDGRSANKAAQRLARVYTDRVKLSNFPAVMGIVKKARNAGCYSDPDIEAALGRLATDGRSVTTDALRYELEGYPEGRTGASTTDQRIAAFLRPKLPNLRALPGGAS